ncbi:MAG TPA: response regulator transcription factor [Thermomicrobiales bacterium]|nr:response regulator transcription factor [Thermomicrobiales bacterium]
MRVLVVDDEEALADAVARGLRQANLAVDIALDGESALMKAEVTPYDVVVLDRQLPDVHGDDVCRQLVAFETPPRILMLTAAGDVHSRIEGLAIGADDYLPKPFVMGELIARIRALHRRPNIAIRPVLTIGDLVVDSSRQAATRAGRELSLTRKEFGVLEEIARANGAIVSSEELLERVWDEAADPFTNAVRITVMTLRRKLGEPGMIETVVGSGYRLCSQE